MPVSWKTIFSKSEPRFGPEARPLRVVRSATARAMRLRVDPRDGEVRLTLPQRASLRFALAWAEEQRPWVETQLGKVTPRCPLVPGLVLPVGGASLRLVHAPERRLSERRDDALFVGGPLDMFETRVLRWLKREALRVLTVETHEIAARAGVTVRRVGVGDTRSRWGSCTVDGDIRYSWRLILAPPHVRRGTVAHEVSHRVHMNHGPAFKALERELLGASPSAGREWLRRHGASLYAWGPVLRA
jgi:predicted metal-dependent hydrolase